MSKRPLFSENGPADLAYKNIMAAENVWQRRARALSESLWEDFEPLADNDFLTEIRTRFDERFWEMYLTVTLKRSGYEVVCPKPGPDVGIVYEGRRIWFEAVSPSRGADGAPDQVPEVKYDGTAQSVPNEKLILRYLNSISEKYERQYQGWLKIGTVSKDDALVIALNPRRLGFETSDTIPPRVLQVAFPVGNAYITFSRSTMATTATGYQFRPALPKSSGTLVETGVFLRDGYEGLSGLLVSRVDAANHPPKLGDDFQLVPNPRATCPLPPHLRLPGDYYAVTETADGFLVTPQRSEGGG